MRERTPKMTLALTPGPGKEVGVFYFWGGKPRKELPVRIPLVAGREILEVLRRKGLLIHISGDPRWALPPRVSRKHIPLLLSTLSPFFSFVFIPEKDEGRRSEALG